MGLKPGDKWDMFDVASGKCELMDFLLTRYNPMDLNTRLNIDPRLKLDEIVAPPPKPAAPQPVFAAAELVIPPEAEVGGPSAPPDAAAAEPAAPPPEAAPEQPAAEQPPAQTPAAPMDPEELQKLIASFHQAAQQYSSQWQQQEEPPPEE